MEKRTILANFLWVIFFLYILSGCKTKSYMVTGSYQDPERNGEYVYLFHVDKSPGKEDYVLMDSARINEGKFIFKGKIKEKPELYLIKNIENKEKGKITLVPGYTEVSLFDDSTSLLAVLKGTELNEQLYRYIIEPINSWQKERMDMMKTPVIERDKEYKKESKKVVYEFLDTYRTQSLNFFKNNPEIPLTKYFLYGIQNLKDEEIHELNPFLDTRTKKTLKRFQTFYQEEDEKRKKKLEVPPNKYAPENVHEGKYFVDLKGKTLDGDTVLVSDYHKKKRLVLLDFWASWCGPCIKEMPVIAKLHDAYKDKGLQVIGISVDKNELAWKKAVEQNDMRWMQLLEFRNKEDDASSIYGIRTIPYTILIDEEGIIINRGLRGEKLINRIHELLEKIE